MLRLLVPLTLAFVSTSAAAAPQHLYIPVDGVVVIEFESFPPVGGWVAETELEGFTGESYYRWTGRGHDALTFRIVIDKPGWWHLRLRNRHEHPDHTLENDAFIRMAIVGGGGDVPEPAWVKCFSSKRGEWTWRSNHEFNHNTKPPARYWLAAGTYEFSVKGRSKNFCIDRIHLYHESVGEKAGTNASLPPTSLQPPVPSTLNAPPDVLDAWRQGRLGVAVSKAHAMRDDPKQTDAVRQQAGEAAKALEDAFERLHKAAESMKATHPLGHHLLLAELGDTWSRSDWAEQQLAIDTRTRRDVLREHQSTYRMLQQASMVGLWVQVQQQKDADHRQLEPMRLRLQAIHRYAHKAEPESLYTRQIDDWLKALDIEPAATDETD